MRAERRSAAATRTRLRWRHTRRARRKEVNHDRTVDSVALAPPPLWWARHFRREGVFHCARGDPPGQPSRGRRNVTRPLTALTERGGWAEPARRNMTRGGRIGRLVD